MIMLILICILVGLWYFMFKRNIHVKEEDANHAMDIFKLHPGTKVLWDDDFEGYQLPSGKVVMHRYWKRLEGVNADY